MVSESRRVTGGRRRPVVLGGSPLNHGYCRVIGEEIASKARREKCVGIRRGEGVRKNVRLGRFCERPAPLPATRGRECQHDSHTRSNSRRMESNKLERSLRLTRQRAVAKRIDRSDRFIVETALVRAR